MNDMSAFYNDNNLFVAACLGIICTDCGAEFDAARLAVLDDQATGERYFFCPKCGSSQIDFALWDDLK